MMLLQNSLSHAAMLDGALEGGILLTIHRLSYGGADRVAMHLANGIAQAGIPTGIAILRTGGEAESTLLGMLRPDVAQWAAGPPMGSRHLELVRGMGFIDRLVSRSRPSVVLASSNNMGLVTGLSSRLRRQSSRPAYVLKTTNPVVRPFDRGPVRKRYRHLLYGLVFSPFDRILNLTEAERDELSQMYPAAARKFAVVRNPYITAAMLDGESVPRTTPRRILTLARMMPQKRLDVLLSAFSHVARKDCRLTILGDGPERPRLEALAKALGISDRVEMPGFTDSVLPWLRRADVFALSSDFEGLPAALLEAFACKVPVVTTDCFVGARTLLANAPGSAVVPRGDPRALARAIDDSLDSKADLAGLRDIARDYEIQAGIDCHLGELLPLLHPGWRRARA
jgi:glycosyltransferase involved in cell wall biosynthesis